MRVYSPVTDYIRRSLLSTVGDLVIRGTVAPSRFPAYLLGRVLACTGEASMPVYRSLFNLLTTKGDFWVQGETTPERFATAADKLYLKAKGVGELPAYEALRLDDVGVKIGNSSRDTTGVQVISGVGYRPSVIIFFACNDDPTLQEFSCGFGTETDSMCMYYSESDSEMRLNLLNALHIESVDPGRLLAQITTLDADGFTLNWTGVPALPTVIFIYLCLP